MPRLFVGIEPGEAARAALSGALPALRAVSPSSKWVAEENLHLTVAFLGSVADEGIGPLREALDRAAAGHAPVALRLAGGGAFGSRGRPRVLWAGVAGEQVAETPGTERTAGPERIAGAGAGAEVALDPELARLHALHGSVASALRTLGHALEARPYHPHITLARARDMRGDRPLTGCVALLASLPPAPIRVDELVLYESHTGRGGSKYEALHRARLG